jgi:REP element-mobilizing transposase RayT
LGKKETPGVRRWLVDTLHATYLPTDPGVAGAGNGDVVTKIKGKNRVETARLREWDYAGAGWYFVTICTKSQEWFFGQVIEQEMNLSPIGQIADQFWQEIPEHSNGVCSLDLYIVMPNHVHGIIVIDNTDTPVEALHDAVETLHDVVETLHDVVETLHCNVSTMMSDISPRAGSLGAMIRSYKAAVTSWCRQNQFPNFGWQTRFHDHIIRNERELNAIRRYILDNPANWSRDQENQPGLFM